MYHGPIVSLEQILESREQRAAKQREWVEAHSLPLISFTINMVGSIKKNHIAKVAFEQGLKAIVNGCVRNNMAVMKMELVEAVTGYETLLAVDSNDIHKLKKMTVQLEDEHPMGRLFDIDVIRLDGRPISRTTIKHPTRRCLVCKQDARTCMRLRSHSTSQIVQKMEELINACQ
ncbi:citrate lyase holo-[acyl-carrier protein] synthase [Vibrio atypicus]|uniref:citrate lyase holo-[acyl-carrier protein] synthase n=1 Tax=Vibrio atypicus TaxID=558271 RepID=UPI001356D94E|nr:citrate lyase holo-[acyl-carrier protein] synthase [Vibrio atypicus]